MGGKCSKCVKAWPMFLVKFLPPRARLRFWPEIVKQVTETSEPDECHKPHLGRADSEDSVLLPEFLPHKESEETYERYKRYAIVRSIDFP